MAHNRHAQGVTAPTPPPTDTMSSASTVSGDESPPSPYVFDTRPLLDLLSGKLKLLPPPLQYRMPLETLASRHGAECPERERIHLPPIENWEDLSCIEALNEFREEGGVSDRAYSILYRMCQTIWAIGHEVEIRKQIKMPRAQRLAKFKWYCETVLEGARLFQRNMKAKIRNITDVAHSLPDLEGVFAYQDLGPRLGEWCEALKGFYIPSLGDFALFQEIHWHYNDNYSVLYALHREKPDYGLTSVLTVADHLRKTLVKLSNYALLADLKVVQFEQYLQQHTARYEEDRGRQHRALYYFHNMPFEEADKCFQEYMEVHHQDFIDKVENLASHDPMSQEEFNEHLDHFRSTFVEDVEEFIKNNDYEWDDEPDPDELAWRLQQVEEQRNAQEALTGWMEALGCELESIDGDGLDEDANKVAAHESSMTGSKTDLPLFEQPQTEWQGKMHQFWLDYEASWQPEDVESAALTKWVEPRNQDEAEKAGQTEIGESKVPDSNLTADTVGACEDLHTSQEHAAYSTRERMQQPHLCSGFSEVVTLAPRLPVHASKSFTTVEQDLAERVHHRSSTAPDTIYITNAAHDSDLPSPGASFHGRAICTRRHGMQVPRIFTGSFSQLETDIRRMQLHKVQTPVDQPALEEKGHIARDFAVTPSPTPSPATLLFRRDALLSKETEIEDRVINGEVVRSRRPSTKARAQTVDATNGGVEAWLGGGRSGADLPTLASSPLPRPERQNTI